MKSINHKAGEKTGYSDMEPKTVIKLQTGFKISSGNQEL